MASLFFRQFAILVWKNWIILLKHPFLNLLRCFIGPVAYGIFLAVAQEFLLKPNNYGLGAPIPIFTLESQFDSSLALIWADGTNGTGSPSADGIMSHITANFSPSQLAAVKKVSSPSDIAAQCPQNFNLFSECFAAVSFDSLGSDSNSSSIGYTINADGGLYHIDVVRHKSDFEKRILPLQWAIDNALIELKTGVSLPTPLEWPFTQETNQEQSLATRLSYVRGIRNLLVLALFICFVGIAYQLPGAFAGERANSLTAHLKAMGLLDSARIVSWHFSISLAYLPAWIIVAVTFHSKIFTATSPLLILLIHLLLGLSLASHSLFISAPFGKSPQLAAVTSTFLSILLAILALVFKGAGNGVAFVFSILFPPGFYVFAMRAVCGWENHQMATDALRGDPDDGLRLLPLIIAAIIDIFLWPYLGVLWECRLYDARNPKSPSSRSWAFWRRKRGDTLNTSSPTHTTPPDIAISIRNLQKTFSNPSWFNRKEGNVTAIADLSLDIPNFGIFVLLGSNGAGKSTALSIIGGLLGRTSGTISFSGNLTQPPRGTIGIVPQKNVLFPELTCLQTLRVWRAIKWSENSVRGDGKVEDIEQLLRDCDLGVKIGANASTLSGGQKRKLQLAVGLVGGSKIVLVDECTSGVDPLSRRALWRTLTSFRNERTIVFTTHFLDEADLLADNIGILAAPGKLVAEGSPVSLKRSLGQGYTVQVSFTPPPPQSSPMHSQEQVKDNKWTGPPPDLLCLIREVAPHTYISTSAAPYRASYHLKSGDAVVVERVLGVLENESSGYGIGSCDVLGTSIEDIFLDLMSPREGFKGGDQDEKVMDEGLVEVENQGEGVEEKDSSVKSAIPSTNPAAAVLKLSNGRSRGPLSQALTIFHKRLLIFRRSWLAYLLAILIGVAGSCVPLIFLTGRQPSCVKQFDRTSVAPVPLYLPDSPILLSSYFQGGSPILTSPPGIVSTLGGSAQFLPHEDVADNATFVSDINANYLNLTIGGVSVDIKSGEALVAWEASPPGLTGPIMLNFASNILFNHALNASSNAGSSPLIINAQYESFPPIDAGTLFALKWIGFFAAAMAVFPAFFSLYVSRERRSSVQAMQMSNGLNNPVGLWLGHLMFDTIFSVLLATIVIIVFATASNQFHGLGLFWIVFVLYGIAGALFSYCASLLMTSPLAAFAAVAGYQIVMFILYCAGYLLTLTYAKTSQAGRIITIIHFTVSLLSPVASLIRAGLVSVNLFSLLCNGSSPVSAASIGTIMTFGGPILYLFVYSFVLLGILVWVDSGSLLPRRMANLRSGAAQSTDEDLQRNQPSYDDVVAEAKVAAQSQDLLRVLNVTKSFEGNKVVDDVSIDVSRNTVFAMLGPNGAGKTTTFNIIRGDVVPDMGDVLIDGVSVVHHPRTARLALGVCPQFTAIDSQLTVREHLMVYGRLKGLKQGEELRDNVHSLMQATSLGAYADRLASKLSGGNQRKLSLAIALIGNPSVILIDEFSTGIDAKMKRDMWGTLRNVAIGKAVVITTHSMEEASALANKVGIIAKRMLAVGTTDDLSARYATYEVHFSCRTREDVTRAQTLMASVPDSKMADDVATRFEVPVEGENGLSLGQLFHLLSTQGDFSEYTVEKATLESVFLKVIRQNNFLEEDFGPKKTRRLRIC